MQEERGRARKSPKSVAEPERSDHFSADLAFLPPIQHSHSVCVAQRTHTRLRFSEYTLLLYPLAPSELDTARSTNTLLPTDSENLIRKQRTGNHRNPRKPLRSQKSAPSARSCLLRGPATQPDQAMYRPPSPIFDVPELPATLRRMKPLPKRRRTSDPASHDGHDLRPSSPAPGLTGTGTDPSQESHDEADDHTPATPDPTLAAQLALQAYYGPVLGGVRDLFKNMPTPTRGGDGDDDASRTSTPISIDLCAALAAGFGTGAGAGGGWYGGVVGGLGALAQQEGQDDEDGENGDYVDHLQQPGNTKKRKVPANMSGSAHGHDAGSGGSGAEDEGGDRAVPTGRERDADAVAGGALNAGTGTGGGGGGGAYGLLALAGKKGRLSRATLAGLQHKDMLKSRKRQLATVLGTLANGDTLALDQALSANTIFVQPQTRVRLSRRRTSRFARALKAYIQSHPPGESEVEGKENKVPSSDFTFVFHSASE